MDEHAKYISEGQGKAEADMRKVVKEFVIMLRGRVKEIWHWGKGTFKKLRNWERNEVLQREVQKLLERQ